MEESEYIKSEPEDPVDYPLPEMAVVASPWDVPSRCDLVDQYCRLCLREKSPLFPIMSRVQNILISDMIAAVTGICINPRDKLPKKVCIQCLLKLDYAYHIRLEFAEAHRVLKSLNCSKVCPLWDSLHDYQKGVLAATESRSEKLLRQNKHIILSSSKNNDQQNADLIVEEQDANLQMDLNPEMSIMELADQIEVCKEDDVNEEKELWSVEPKDMDGIDQLNEEETQDTTSEKIMTIANYRVKIKETKLDPNKCYICKADFANPNDVQVHLPDHAHMVPYDCEECKATRLEAKTIYTVVMLHRHFRMHAGSIKCPKCAFRTCSSHGLYGHIKRFHMDKPNTIYKCEICGANVKNKKSFECHLRMHKAVEEGRFKCSFCAKKFGTKTRLERHERIHTDERPYQCRYCIKAFTTETALQAHERSHTGEKGYRCEECEKGFRTRASLSMHMEITHQMTRSPLNRSSSGHSQKYVLFENPAKCPYEGCDFETMNRSQYYNHKAKHDLRFHCPHCEQRFPTKQRLEMHLYVHTELKTFCCDICGKSFRYRVSFLEHMASHSNHRPYTCAICGMSFVRDRTLKEHVLKHSDQLTYACRYCGKKIRYRADLSKHEKTHAIGETVTKEEVVIDFDNQKEMDVIVEEYDEEDVLVEYLDE